MLSYRMDPDGNVCIASLVGSDGNPALSSSAGSRQSTSGTSTTRMNQMLNTFLEDSGTVWDGGVDTNSIKMTGTERGMKLRR